ncbi:MAG: cation-translocating P-type ATPase [Spirochaetia bacterium]|nr:cation-translocating P-type ATPase [Spirochaetia bacterium]
MYCMNKKTILISLSAVSLILSFFNVFKLPFDLSWAAILLCGIPIIFEAGEALIKDFDITADVLVAMAIIASVCIGEYFAAGEVALIMTLGEELENFTVEKARKGLQRLVSLSPVKARVLHGNTEHIVAVDQVQVGDILKILPGETVPVDGVILSGQTSIDQSAMTGESLPVDKKGGDEVSSGTVNQFGSFTMKALRRGEDSSIQRMIQLVESADAGKAKIVHLADRWAFWIVLIALSTAVITGIVTRDIIRSVTVLVVFCPCALVLATPVAIVAAIGNVSKHGFLVKEGDALERLATVRKVALDKTGTLTYGVPSVVAVVSTSPGLTEQELFHIAASAEQFSEHPLGKAVVTSYRKTTERILSETSDFVMLPGNGVRAVVAGAPVIAGNSNFLQNSGILLAKEFLAASEVYQKQGCTVIYIAKEGRVAGFIALADELRPESSPLMKRLKYLGVEPVLLTGDTHAAASSVVSRLEIDEFHAGCLPEDKMAHIAQYQKEHKPVCMIGDGINDAPALRLADVGIAMGKIGSDIAATAADIVLINDHIHAIDHIIALSRRMMTTIRCNIIFSMSLNFLAVLMAVTGCINPVAGALVHNGGSFLVIANSALLLYYKRGGLQQCPKGKMEKRA